MKDTIAKIGTPNKLMKDALSMLARSKKPLQQLPVQQLGTWQGIIAA